MILKIPDGQGGWISVPAFKGDPGTPGGDGRGIVSIAKTGTAGLIDTYTITYSDGTTSTYTVSNGADGEGVIFVKGFGTNSTEAGATNIGDIYYSTNKSATYYKKLYKRIAASGSSAFEELHPATGTLCIMGDNIYVWNGTELVKATNIEDISEMIIDEGSGSVKYTDGTIQNSTGSWAYIDYLDISRFAVILITSPITSVTNDLGFAFYDSNKVYISGIPMIQGAESTDQTIVKAEVPEGAKFVRATYRADTTTWGKPVCYGISKAICMFVKNEVKEAKDELQGMIDNIGATVNEDNIKVISYGSDYVLLSAVKSAHYIELNSDYRIYTAMLIGPDGTVANTKLLNTISRTGASAWETRYRHGYTQIPRGYAIQYQVKKADGGPIAEGESVVKKFELMDAAKLHREPLTTPGMAEAWQRAYQLLKLQWTPLANLPARGSLNSEFYGKNKTEVTLPYSGVYQYNKFVGIDISPRTFLTALQNKRSLMYTENLRQGSISSGYGISYYNLNNESSTYYGIVCSGFVSHVLGLDFLVPSDQFVFFDGMVEIPNPNADNVRPFDVFIESGHVYTITDIYKDDFGKVKYIVISEAVTPLCASRPYTAEWFNLRMGDCLHAFRYEDLGERTDVPDWSQWVAAMPEDVIQNVVANHDICTFAGDYATFATGDKIYLNAIPGSTYTKVQLYKDEEPTPTEIDITALSPDADGYVDINLTDRNLTAGKYKARLANAAGQYSDYTYFEVVGIEISRSNKIVTYSVTGGHVVYVATCGDMNTIKMSNVHQPTTDSGTITFSSLLQWIKVLAEGDYGKVSKNLAV